jgi:hypothetical protein
MINLRAVLIVIFIAGLAVFSARAQVPEGLSMTELEARVGTLMQQSCALSGCHAAPVPMMNLDLHRERFVMATVNRAAVTRPDLKLVEPGQPGSSYLMMKIEGADGIVGSPMPFGGDRLSRDQIDLVRTWITRLGTEPPTEPGAEAREYYPFLGWRVINLPTSRRLAPWSLLITIGHRFNPRLDSGYETFFGLDGSGIIFLGLGFAVADGLAIHLGRSNADNDVEFGLQFELVRQMERGPPVSVGVRGTVNWFTERPLGGGSVFRPDAFKMSSQLVVSHALGHRAGLSLVPGILFNPAMEIDGEPPVITLGLGGRWRVAGNTSLLLEWVPVVSGFARTATFGNQNRFDSWGTGLEIATAGHVFQIVVTNSVGIATDQYMRGGDLDVSKAHVRLGFNIFRVINL